MVTNMMKHMRRMSFTWKSRSSTARFVTMFYRSWTELFQHLGFETVRIHLGWRQQWKVTPWRLEMKHHRTAHLPLSWPASSATRSPDPPLPPADLTNEDFQLIVVTNAKLEKMIANDIDGHGDDDGDDGKDGEHEHQHIQGSVLWACSTDPGQDASKT